MTGSVVSVDFLKRRVAELEQRGAPAASLKGGGGDGTFDGMEARVTALEKRFDKFEAKLDTLIKDVAEMKGRVSAMPTTWQLIGMVLAIMGASFAMIRFGVVKL